MSLRAVMRIFLGAIVLILSVACVEMTMTAKQTEVLFAEKTASYEAEIVTLDEKKGTYSDAQAQAFLQKAEAARENTEDLNNRTERLNALTEEKRAKSAELFEERDYYAEIYNEYVEGKNKVEGYIANGN